MRTGGARLSALVLLAACLRCGPAVGEFGQAEVLVFGASLATEDVHRVVVSVSGPGIAAPIARDLGALEDGWRGVLGEVPVGAERRFDATALDASGLVLFEGRALGVEITPGPAVPVGIVLQQHVAPDPFRNTPPVIESFTASPGVVAPGARARVSVTASDPDPGDVASFEWTATAGTFSRANIASTEWTAPILEGSYTLTVFVRDTRGAARSLRATLVVSADPGAPSGPGPELNTWPELTGFGADPTLLAPGGTTVLFVVVRDDDGDPLSLTYSDDCGGSFEASTWRAPAVSARRTCQLGVRVDDGRGGWAVRSLALTISDEVERNRAPALAGRSAAQAEFSGPGVIVSLEVSATDADGDALSFDWSATSGVLAAPVSTSTMSRVAWTAGAVDAVITVRAFDARGASAVATFERARTRNPAPSVRALEPAAVVTGAAELDLRVLGAAFVSGARVRIDGQPLATTRLSSTELTAVLPPWLMRSARTAFLTVENPEPHLGTSAATPFVVQHPTPTITAIAPSSVVEGAALLRLTIDGDGFVPGARVTFAGAALATTFESATTLTALLPATASSRAGWYDVQVENAAPHAGPSAARTFVVEHATPTLTGLSPSEVTLGDDVALTLDGAGFVPGVVVTCDGATLATTFVSATELIAVLPRGLVSTWGTSAVSALNPAPTAGPSASLALEVSPPPSSARTIAAGGHTTCVIGASGTVACVGANHYGALGDGTTAHSTTLVELAGLAAVEQVSVGNLHTCAVHGGGAVSCWGWNRYGQLGDGTTVNRTTPTLVSGLSGIVEVVAGVDRTCARSAAGQLWCWGRNHLGQLGDGTQTDRPAPVVVPIPTPTIGLAVRGEYHGCAVTRAAAAWCWGANTHGQLGDATTLDHATPALVAGLVDVARIHTRDDSSYALSLDGTLSSWGANPHGALGRGGTTASSVPGEVVGLGDVVALASAAAAPCALRADGTVWCWGLNTRGNLGDGTTLTRTTPAEVVGIIDAVELTAGEEHVVVRLTDGTLYTWGGNQLGELGDGTHVDRPSPVLLAY